MGRKDGEELSAAQIFYPCMQCADIFFLKADICQLVRGVKGGRAAVLYSPATSPTVPRLPSPPRRAWTSAR